MGTYCCLFFYSSMFYYSTRRTLMIHVGKELEGVQEGLKNFASKLRDQEKF